MKKATKVKLSCLIALFAFTGFCFFYWATPQPPLRKEWEGLYKDKNFRDLGKSMNACLGREVFQPGLAFRANRYFSGWSCAHVGSPSAIISLNHTPRKNETAYCVQADGSFLTGKYANTTFQIADIEDLKQWNRPEFRRAVCAMLTDGFAHMSDQKSILFHCDAGRDRTGAFAAILTAAVAEEHNRLDETMKDGIECDYRKTASLTPQKYGRMKAMISQMQAQGGVRSFLQKQCGISAEIITHAAQNFMH